MFKVGERVVYPPQGIGVIEAIEDREIEGKKVLFYAIKLLKRTSGNFRVMVPVNGTEGRGLRSPVQKEEIPRVLSALSSPEGEELPSDYRERFPLIKKKLESGDLYQVVEAIRDLDTMKELSGMEKSLLESARRQLIEELAYVRKSRLWEIEEEIEGLLKRRRKACRGKKKK